MTNLERFAIDYKNIKICNGARTDLQEICIKNNLDLPACTTTNTGGLPHCPIFSCNASGGRFVVYVVNAPSKQSAENAAFSYLLKMVREGLSCNRLPSPTSSASIPATQPAERPVPLSIETLAAQLMSSLSAKQNDDIQILQDKIKRLEDENLILADKVDVLQNKTTELETQFTTMKMNVQEALDLFNTLIAKLPKCLADGFGSYLASVRNRLMHALNGNTENRKEHKKEIKKAVQTAVKAEHREMNAARRPRSRSARSRAGGKVVFAPKTKFTPKVKAQISRNAARLVAPIEKAAKNGGGGWPNTIKTKRSGALAIARAITTPCSAPGVRWGSPFAQEPTALASPFERVPVPWAKTPGADPNFLDNYQNFLAVFRDMTRAYVYYDPNVGAASYWYDIVFNSVLDSFSTSTPTYNYVFVSSGEQQFLPSPKASANADLVSYPFRPHGPFLYAGTPDGKPEISARYLWMDKGASLAGQFSVVTTAASSFNCRVAIDRFTPGGIKHDAAYANMAFTGPFVPEIFSITVPESGYYAIRAMTEIDQLVTMSVDGIHLTGNTNSFCHRPVKDLELNIGRVNSWRMHGVSACYTNDAAPNYREGKIATLQAKIGDSWTDYVGAWGKVSSVSGSDAPSITEGQFGFLRPSGKVDYELQCYHRNGAGTLIDSYYPLLPVCEFLILNPYVTDTANGQDGRYTISWSFEFTTKDTWSEVANSDTPQSVYDAGLEVVKHVTQWHGNPVHLSEIWNKIKSFGNGVANGIRTYGPSIMRAADIAASLFA